ncbi:hypothetical protein MMC34_001418 [Xylographa carneopallida]|nr:hypothetical protein [Xylographa carneopallida]
MEYEQRQHERQGIEALDTCLAYNYDKVAHQQAEQLNLAIEESTRLRVIIQELIEAEDARVIEATTQDSQHVQRLPGSDSTVLNRYIVERDSLSEFLPAADSAIETYGCDEWEKLDNFFRAVAENLTTDSGLLNLIADYEVETQRLRRLIDAPILVNDQPAEKVHNDHRTLRRVCGEKNLSAICQKTAANGKGKAE